MNIIRSYSKFGEYLSDQLIPMTDVNKNEIRWGWFHYVDSGLTILYVIKHQLLFSLNEYVFDVKNTSALIKEIDGNHRSFKLYKNNVPIAEFKYEIDRSLSMIQPFDYIEEEDFDWGVFLSNIINDAERQNRILENVL